MARCIFSQQPANSGPEIIASSSPYCISNAGEKPDRETVRDDVKDLQDGLGKHGFELVRVGEPDLMADDPGRILVRQMMGAAAQYENSQIVLKLPNSAVHG